MANLAPGPGGGESSDGSSDSGFDTKPGAGVGGAGPPGATGGQDRDDEDDRRDDRNRREAPPGDSEPSDSGTRPVERDKSSRRIPTDMGGRKREQGIEVVAPGAADDPNAVRQAREFEEQVVAQRAGLNEEDVRIERDGDRLRARVTESFAGRDAERTSKAARRGAFGGTSERAAARRDARQQAARVQSAFRRGALGRETSTTATDLAPRSGFETRRRFLSEQAASELSQRTGRDVDAKDIAIDFEDGTATARLTEEGRRDLEQQTPELDAFVAGVEESLGVDLPGEGGVARPDDEPLFGNVDLRASDPFTERDGSTGVGTTGMGVTLPEGTTLQEGGTVETEFSQTASAIRRSIASFSDDVIDPTRPFEADRGGQGPMGVTIPESTAVNTPDEPSAGTRFVRGAVGDTLGFVASAPFDTAVAAKDAAELAGGVVSGDTGAGEIATTATFSGAQAAESGLSAPARTAGGVVGSLALTGGLFKATQGTALSAPTRYALQPGEEIAGKVGARVLPGRAGRALFPNEEPIIFSEEAAIRGAQRGADVASDVAARAKKRARREAVSARFKAAEIRREGSDARLFSGFGDRRGQTTLVDMVPEIETEAKSPETRIKPRSESRERANQRREEAERQEVTNEPNSLERRDTARAETGNTQSDILGLSKAVTRPRAEVGQETRLDAETGLEQGFETETELRTETEIQTETETETELETLLETDSEQEQEIETELRGGTETETELEPLIPEADSGDGPETRDGFFGFVGEERTAFRNPLTGEFFEEG